MKMDTTILTELEALRTQGWSYNIGHAPNGYFCSIWKDNPPSYKRSIVREERYKNLSNAIQLSLHRINIGDYYVL